MQFPKFSSPVNRTAQQPRYRSRWAFASTMKLVSLPIVLPLVAFGQDGISAFETVRVGDMFQVDLPKNWTYMDTSVADHLNTSSEAMAKIAGTDINQGDNKILIAANAYDSAGKSKAGFRFSIRVTKSVAQSEMRELAMQPSSVVDSELRPAADVTVKAMLNVPGVKSYSVRAVKLDRNNSLVCIYMSFDGDLGSAPVIVDTWVCPLGDRTLKLTTSYTKALQAIYRPTLERIWTSLRVTSGN